MFVITVGEVPKTGMVIDAEVQSWFRVLPVWVGESEKAGLLEIESIRKSMELDPGVVEEFTPEVSPDHPARNVPVIGVRRDGGAAERVVEIAVLYNINEGLDGNRSDDQVRQDIINDYPRNQGY